MYENEAHLKAERDVADISRLSAMSQQFAQQEMDAQASSSNLIGGIISAIGGPVAGVVTKKILEDI